MAELLRMQVIRPAESLSPKKRDAIAYITHKAPIVSERYKRWKKLAKRHKAKKLYTAIEQFVNEKSTTKSIDEFPKPFMEILQYADYNGYDFSVDEFQRYATQERLTKLFGKKLVDGEISSATLYVKLRCMLEDILLAQAVLDQKISLAYSATYALLTLEFCKKLLFASENRQMHINVQKHFETPIVLNAAAIFFDPCNSAVPNSVPKRDAARALKQQKYKTGRCVCLCEDDCVAQSRCCDEEIVPYLAELFVVKDEVEGYEPGEISYIENIMKDEIRVRKHRHLQREEIYTEQEKEVNTFKEKEFQTDEKLSVHKEIDKMIEQELAMNAGVSYDLTTQGQVPTPIGTLNVTTTFGTEFNISNKTVKKEARKLVQESSKEIIEKAISRVEKSVRTLATRKVIDEIEEKNKHVFGGDSGASSDMSRQFYYVNQVRKAQVYSYGVREIIDLTIPEPAALYKHLLKIPFEEKDPGKFTLVEPNCSKINPKNYKEYGKKYDVSLPSPPAKKTCSQIVRNVDKTNVGKNEQIYMVHVQIPKGCVAKRMYVSEMDIDDERKKDRSLWIDFQGAVIGWRKTSNKPDGLEAVDETFLNIGEGEYEIKLTATNLRSFTTRFAIVLEGIAPDLTEWRQEVCDLLIEAYDKKKEAHRLAVEAYEKVKEAHERQQQELRDAKYNQHPFVMSEMIREQLQQAVISYIACQFFDSNHAMKNRVKPCGFPQMDIAEAKKEGEFVRFFEHAFEWKFMNYVLYPSFWGRKCTWKEKAQEEGSKNKLFNKFLEAGSARVSIAVRPGFEELVNYYLKFRRVWGYDGTIPTAGLGFLPIIQEIKEDKENFNTQRDGYVVWSGSLGRRDQLVLYGNDDYFVDEIDPNTQLPTGNTIFDPSTDINREITIECVTYRILAIEEINGEIVMTLDRDLEEICSKSFEALYENRHLPWSIGALFVGSAWKYKVPTSLVWLREESRCLPCSYPIKCEE